MIDPPLWLREAEAAKARGEDARTQAAATEAAVHHRTCRTGGDDKRPPGVHGLVVLDLVPGSLPHVR